MTLSEKIDSHPTEHLAGLIRGDELRGSEIEHWITLLQMADEHKTPVKRARFFGFSFISRKSDIPAAIQYLAYAAI